MLRFAKPHATALALLLLVLGGCTLIPLRTLWALRQFDMMAFDPAQLRAALRLPSHLVLPRDAVALDLTLTRGSTGEVLSRRLWLRPVVDAQARAALAGNAPAASVAASTLRLPADAVVLALDEADQRALRQLREQAAGWKTASASAPDGAKNSVGLQLLPQPCRKGAAAMGDERVTAWVHWAPQPGWLLMADNAPLAELMSAAAPPIAACAS